MGPSAGGWGALRPSTIIQLFVDPIRSALALGPTADTSHARFVAPSRLPWCGGREGVRWFT